VQISTGAQLSIDVLAALKPDLVLAWRDGIKRDDIDRIAAFGTTVFVASARNLATSHAARSGWANDGPRHERPRSRSTS
jgi:ABC-type Fe3+-hydroxamate transport system substrate-binding protein